MARSGNSPLKEKNIAEQLMEQLRRDEETFRERLANIKSNKEKELKEKKLGDLKRPSEKSEFKKGPISTRVSDTIIQLGGKLDFLELQYYEKLKRQRESKEKNELKGPSGPRSKPDLLLTSSEIEFNKLFLQKFAQHSEDVGFGFISSYRMMAWDEEHQDDSISPHWKTYKKNYDIIHRLEPSFLLDLLDHFKKDYYDSTHSNSFQKQFHQFLILYFDAGIINEKQLSKELSLIKEKVAAQEAAIQKTVEQLKTQKDKKENGDFDTAAEIRKREIALRQEIVKGRNKFHATVLHALSEQTPALFELKEREALEKAFHETQQIESDIRANQQRIEALTSKKLNPYESDHKSKEDDLKAAREKSEELTNKLQIKNDELSNAFDRFISIQVDMVLTDPIPLRFEESSFWTEALLYLSASKSRESKEEQLKNLEFIKFVKFKAKQLDDTLSIEQRVRLENEAAKKKIEYDRSIATADEALSKAETLLKSTTDEIAQLQENTESTLSFSQSEMIRSPMEKAYAFLHQANACTVIDPQSDLSEYITQIEKWSEEAKANAKKYCPPKKPPEVKLAKELVETKPESFLEEFYHANKINDPKRFLQLFAGLYGPGIPSSEPLLSSDFNWEQYKNKCDVYNAFVQYDLNFLKKILIYFNKYDDKNANGLFQKEINLWGEPFEKFQIRFRNFLMGHYQSGFNKKRFAEMQQSMEASHTVSADNVDPMLLEARRLTAHLSEEKLETKGPAPQKKELLALKSALDTNKNKTRPSVELITAFYDFYNAQFQAMTKDEKQKYFGDKLPSIETFIRLHEKLSDTAYEDDDHGYLMHLTTFKMAFEKMAVQKFKEQQIEQLKRYNDESRVIEEKKIDVSEEVVPSRPILSERASSLMQQISKAAHEADAIVDFLEGLARLVGPTTRFRETPIEAERAAVENLHHVAKVQSSEEILGSLLNRTKGSLPYLRNKVIIAAIEQIQTLAIKALSLLDQDQDDATMNAFNQLIQAAAITTEEIYSKLEPEDADTAKLFLQCKQQASIIEKNYSALLSHLHQKRLTYKKMLADATEAAKFIKDTEISVFNEMNSDNEVFPIKDQPCEVTYAYDAVRSQKDHAEFLMNEIQSSISIVKEPATPDSDTFVKNLKNIREKTAEIQALAQKTRLHSEKIFEYLIQARALRLSNIIQASSLQKKLNLISEKVLVEENADEKADDTAKGLPFEGIRTRCQEAKHSLARLTEKINKANNLDAILFSSYDLSEFQKGIPGIALEFIDIVNSKLATLSTGQLVAEDSVNYALIDRNIKKLRTFQKKFDPNGLNNSNIDEFIIFVTASDALLKIRSINDEQAQDALTTLEAGLDPLNPNSLSIHQSVNMDRVNQDAVLILAAVQRTTFIETLSLAQRLELFKTIKDLQFYRSIDQLVKASQSLAKLQEIEKRAAAFQASPVDEGVGKSEFDEKEKPSSTPPSQSFHVEAPDYDAKYDTPEMIIKKNIDSFFNVKLTYDSDKLVRTIIDEKLSGHVETKEIIDFIVWYLPPRFLPWPDKYNDFASLILLHCLVTKRQSVGSNTEQIVKYVQRFDEVLENFKTTNKDHDLKEKFFNAFLHLTITTNPMSLTSMASQCILEAAAELDMCYSDARTRWIGYLTKDPTFYGNNDKRQSSAWAMLFSKADLIDQSNEHKKPQPQCLEALFNKLKTTLGETITNQIVIQAITTLRVLKKYDQSQRTKNLIIHLMHLSTAKAEDLAITASEKRDAEPFYAKKIEECDTFEKLYEFFQNNIDHALVETQRISIRKLYNQAVSYCLFESTYFSGSKTAFLEKSQRQYKAIMEKMQLQKPGTHHHTQLYNLLFNDANKIYMGNRYIEFEAKSSKSPSLAT